MFTNSAVLRPVSFASFQYQQEVLPDELLYQLVLFPEIITSEPLRNDIFSFEPLRKYYVVRSIRNNRVS